MYEVIAHLLSFPSLDIWARHTGVALLPYSSRVACLLLLPWGSKSMFFLHCRIWASQHPPSITEPITADQLQRIRYQAGLLHTLIWWPGQATVTYVNLLDAVSAPLPSAPHGQARGPCSNSCSRKKPWSISSVTCTGGRGGFCEGTHL